MKINTFGEHVYNQEDLVDLLRQDPSKDIAGARVDFAYQDLLDLGLGFIQDQESSQSLEDYDAANQATIVMPQEYHNLDIAEYVLSLCKTEQQLQRVGQELLLYCDRGMFPLLQYLKYLVDTMKKHNLIWGLGRGSSVASYVLYLLEVHRVDSLAYELDIQEFLR